MVKMLNAHFGILSEAIIARGGEVLQFIGDAALGIFECATDAADQRRACTAAFEAAGDALAKTRRAEHGPCGAEPAADSLRRRPAYRRCDLRQCRRRNAFGLQRGGPAVNLTARLESLSKETGTPLLMSAALAAALGRDLSPVGTFTLKGVAEAQRVFTSVE